MESKTLLELPYIFLQETKRKNPEIIDKLDLRGAIKYYEEEWGNRSDEEKNLIVNMEKQRKKKNQKIRKKDFRGKRAYSNYIKLTSHLFDDGFTGKEYSDILKLFWNCYRPSPDDKYKQLHPEEKDIYSYCKSTYFKKLCLQGATLEECEISWKQIKYDEQFENPIKQLSKQLSTIIAFLKQKATSSYIESKAASYFLLVNEDEVSNISKFIIKETVSDPFELFENYPRVSILIEYLQSILSSTAINQYLKETPLNEKLRLLNKYAGNRGLIKNVFIESVNELGIKNTEMASLFDTLWDIINIERK